jgi:hypothetical protein
VFTLNEAQGKAIQRILELHVIVWKMKFCVAQENSRQDKDIQPWLDEKSNEVKQIQTLIKLFA